MHRWTDLSQVPRDLEASVVTIGNFDGVHRGHQEVLGRTVADARRDGATSVAVTFDPHPAQVHRPDQAPPLITGLRDRLDLLASTGLDAVLVATYDLDFASQGPAEFVRDWLVHGLRARTVVVGHDVRFGRGNAGDLSTMVDLGARFGFDVDVLHDAGDAGRGVGERRWSSSWVRELLVAGDVAAASRVLGRPHRVRGVVVHGDARGRELGFPTANLGADAEGLVPADGVYAGHLRRHGGAGPAMPAAISIGTNPTFDGAQRRVEAYVVGRTDLDLYGEQVLLELAERLRPTQRFDSVDALVDQMHLDVRRTVELLVAGGA